MKALDHRKKSSEIKQILKSNDGMMMQSFTWLMTAMVIVAALEANQFMIESQKSALTKQAKEQFESQMAHFVNNTAECTNLLQGYEIKSVNDIASPGLLAIDVPTAAGTNVDQLDPKLTMAEIIGQFRSEPLYLVRLEMAGHMWMKDQSLGIASLLDDSNRFKPHKTNAVHELFVSIPSTPTQDGKLDQTINDCQPPGAKSNASIIDLIESPITIASGQKVTTFLDATSFDPQIIYTSSPALQALLGAAAAHGLNQLNVVNKGGSSHGHGSKVGQLNSGKGGSGGSGGHKTHGKGGGSGKGWVGTNFTPPMVGI